MDLFYAMDVQSPGLVILARRIRLAGGRSSYEVDTDDG
jgi:hypothetical protein